jgi:hypothetical protein
VEVNSYDYICRQNEIFRVASRIGISVRYRSVFYRSEPILDENSVKYVLI